MSLTLAPFARALRRSLGIRTSENDIACLSYANVNPINGATGPVVDKGGRFHNAANGKTVSENFQALDTADQIAMLTATGLVRANTANLLHHLYTPGGNILGVANLGTQTTAPTIVAAGLDIGGVATDDIGHEIFSHFAGATGRPFVVGHDPAFYFKATLTIADISGTDTLLIGFRRAEVNNGTLASYADYIGVGVNTAANPGALKLISEVNGSAPSNYPVDTTQTLADATLLTVKVKVSAAGAVTFELATGSNALAAPTVTEAATLDDGDPVIPFIHFLNSSDLAGSVVIGSWEAGYQ